MAAGLPLEPGGASHFKRPEDGRAGEVVRLGTCSWSFEDWRDVFYPDGLASGQELAYYAAYLPAVEVDATFYGAPRPVTPAAWAAKTPERFAFTAKMPRQITHEARLRDSAGQAAAFVESLRPLGSRLEAVLVQLPPTFRPATDEDALRAFLAELPAGPRFAVEFRNAEWRRRRFVRLLEEHRIAWVWADASTVADHSAAPFVVLPQTTDFLYLRLLGDVATKFRPDGKRRFRYGSLLWPRDEALEGWARRIERRLGDCQRIFVMADNHFEGFSPLTCQRLGKLIGIPLELPSLIAHAPGAGGSPVERDEQMPLL